MKKKWWAAGVGFGVGAVLLLTSGLSAMADTSGYEAYMQALKQTKAQSSVTAHADVTVTDNGTKLLSGTAIVKLNREPLAGSVAATIGDGTRNETLNVYCEDGKLIFKSADDDVYRVMKHEEGTAPWASHGGPQDMPEAAQKIIGALMGNMKELATVGTEAEGSRHASLHVTNSQIPAVIQTIASLAASRQADGSGWRHESAGLQAGQDSAAGAEVGFTHPDLHVDLPKLTDHFQVEAVNLDAEINPDNTLAEQTAEIQVTGTDSKSVNHIRVIQVHVVFSGYNKTTPERIDLTGKQTVEMKQSWPHRGWHH